MSTGFPVTTITALLRATVDLLHAEVLALPAEATRVRPAPGEWCINEVLGHLIEAETRGFAGRIRQFLVEEQPLCQPWNPDQVAAERQDQAQSALGLWQTFATLRATSLQLVEGLTPLQLARQGHHPSVGVLSVNDLLHEWIYHDRNHIKQILSIVQAEVWPYMGHAQRFSQPS